jgi:outer membrane protein assembly factor BamB
MDLIITPGKVYAGMAGPGGRVFAYSRDTGARLWRRKSNGDVQAIALRGKTLYVGGHFTIWAEIPDTVELVAVQPKTGEFKETIVRFEGRPYPGVWAIMPSASALYLGGAFHLADGVHERYAAFPAR